jgi:hypothetical protein
VLRPSLPAAPAILLDANVPGAGKGKAGRALAVIATGRPPAVITEGHTAEETEKRLAAAILSGASCVMLDNLQGFLASSTLESGLTEGVATIRLFGKLEDVTVPCSALVVLTANNAAFRPDLLRRTLPVRIVADTDRPELRRFPFDPYEEARANRPAIVAAGLTIARAWWAARGTGEGREVERATLGSFEAWAALVGGAVAWLTGLHPIDLIEERKEVDPVLGAERRVFSALWDLFGEREWIAKDAAGEPAEFGRAGAGTGVDPEGWVAALPPFKGARPTSREVGYWLRKRRDRVVGDWQLTGRQDRNGVSLWRLRARPGVTPPRRRVDELAPLDPPGDGPS